MNDRDSLSVLRERLRTLEKEIEERKLEYRELRVKMEKKFEKLEEDVGNIFMFNDRIKIMFENFLESHKEVKKDIKIIAEKVEKDQSWRGILWDLIKDVIKFALIILVFLATGKFVTF